MPTRQLPTPALRGLTWDHPRGYAVLDALAAMDAADDYPYGSVPAPIAWDRQSLHGFESHPIADLARDHDIVIIDHPGLGDALRDDALLPMEELFTTRELAYWRATTIGHAFDSYRLDDRQWALPLDAAAQVCIVRPDLLDTEPPLTTWADVCGLARRHRITLCLGGPHALLTLLALCLAVGGPRALPPHEAALADLDIATTAMETLAELVAHADPVLSLETPINVLDAMAGDATVACCPLIFGYVSYSSRRGGVHHLRALNAPRWHLNRTPGSVLGGTGLAVSARVGDRQAARAHLSRLMSVGVQTRLAPRVGGQPSAYAVWLSPDVNAATDHFYRSTLATVAAAWVRPREPGWIAFQSEGSALVRDALLDRMPAARAVQRLNAAYRASLCHGGDPPANG